MSQGEILQLLITSLLSGAAGFFGGIFSHRERVSKLEWNRERDEKEIDRRFTDEKAERDQAIWKVKADMSREVEREAGERVRAVQAVTDRLVTLDRRSLATLKLTADIARKLNIDVRADDIVMRLLSESKESE